MTNVGSSWARKSQRLLPPQRTKDGKILTCLSGGPVRRVIDTFPHPLSTQRIIVTHHHEFSRLGGE
jgi:hypothetical protein